MGLLMDGQCTTLDDLIAYDSGILEVAKAENIDLDSKLALATREIALHVSAFLLRRGVNNPINGLPLDEHHVVNTEALKLYHLLHTLVLVYSDASFKQMNEKYRNKYKLYTERELQAQRLLYQLGVGVVYSPVPRAPAAEVRLEAGGSLGDVVTVQLSYVRSDGVEGEAGPPVVVDANGAQYVGIRPPYPASAAAYQYKVYAAVGGAATRCVSAAPLPLDTEYLFNGQQLPGGATAPSGQQPDYYVRNSRVR